MAGGWRPSEPGRRHGRGWRQTGGEAQCTRSGTLRRMRAQWSGPGRSVPRGLLPGGWRGWGSPPPAPLQAALRRCGCRLPILPLSPLSAPPHSFQVESRDQRELGPRGAGGRERDWVRVGECVGGVWWELEAGLRQSPLSQPLVGGRQTAPIWGLFPRWRLSAGGGGSGGDGPRVVPD